MSDRKMIKIGEIGKLITGKTPKTSNCSYYGGKIPFLTPSDDMSVKYVRKTRRYLTEEGRLSVKGATLPKNAICVSCIGSDLGKVVITTEQTVTNQQINSIIVDEDKYDVNYIYYAMLQLGKILNYHSKTSTAVPIVNKGQFSMYEIQCPSLGAQKKIGSLLSRIDEKIENNVRINNNLEQQAIVVFNNMFPHIFQGDCTIGDYILPKKGKNFIIKNALPGNVPIVAAGLKPAAYHNKANTYAPTLAISASGANAGYVSLWSIPIWSSDSSFIDASMTDDVYFWYVLLKTRQNEIFDAQSGSAQPHIYPKDIASMKLSALNMSDVRKYTSIVTPFFKKIGDNQREMQNLSTLRDVLLPKLLNGTIGFSNIKD